MKIKLPFEKTVNFAQESQVDGLLKLLEELIEQEYICSIVIKKYRRTRSNEQNSYYWGTVLHMISDYTGHESDELHEFFKAKFNSLDVDIMGEAVKIPQTTTAGDTFEFSQYVEKIKDWAASNLDLFIPDPD